MQIDAVDTNTVKQPPIDLTMDIDQPTAIPLHLPPPADLHSTIPHIYIPPTDPNPTQFLQTTLLSTGTTPTQAKSILSQLLQHLPLTDPTPPTPTHDLSQQANTYRFYQTVQYLHNIDPTPLPNPSTNPLHPKSSHPQRQDPLSMHGLLLGIPISHPPQTHPHKHQTRHIPRGHRGRRLLLQLPLPPTF